MNKTPPYDPIDPGYWDKTNLRSEIERVFGLCADCRLCVKFCGSFPKMFDAIDNYCTEEKYAEVDTKKLKIEDVDTVVDLCFQCKLCYIKCPYTPGSHDWSIDFPRLIARAKTQRVKETGLSFSDQVLGKPDLLGIVGSWTSPLANWFNESKINRQVLQAAMGIHKDKKLPPFAWKTFAARFKSNRKEVQRSPAAKIAFFCTCYVNYNDPGLGLDTLEVMARNNVDVAFAYEQCCGMPSWHNGDMAGATAAVEKNVQTFARHIAEGRIIVATNPTCSQMIRVEYPRLLGTEQAKTVAAKTMDPAQFLASLASQGKLNRNFKTSAGKVNYHMPCHLRAQKIGYKTPDLLSLLPNTRVKIVEECSGHDGTWAMKKENFQSSLKWGSRAFRAMTEDNPDVTCSDCPLAAIQIEQGTGRHPLNPIEILARSYRGEQIVGTDKGNR
jgi:Fe-S oxidoreductase